MPKLWHILRSKSNKESFLAGQLESRNVEFYYPQLIVQPVNPRCCKIRPYFPGYLFICTDLSINDSILFSRIPGATGLVFVGGEAGYIPENIVHAIRSKVEEINENGGELFEVIKKGDWVKIQSGPFEGYNALFDSRIDGSERVRLLLNMLQGRKLVVEMPAGNISLKKATSRSR